MAAFESQKRAIPLKTALRVANHDRRKDQSVTIKREAQIKTAPEGAAGSAQNFFQFVQIPGIGADLAALPAGYHGLVNVHRIRKLGLSQAFGLSGGGNIKLDRRKGTLAFTGKIA